MRQRRTKLAEPFVGCLLGTAVGDALGLPYEGLTARRAARLFPDAVTHRFLFGKGMVSDDTEHACFTAQALLRARGDAARFRRRLAWSLRWWLAALPAGVGFATLRAVAKLWIGIPPARSGVFSAGNGPAMRSPILGVALGHDRAVLERFVKASTEITHSDRKAYYASLAVAVAAYQSAFAETLRPGRFRAEIESMLSEQDARELLELIERAAESAAANEAVAEFAARIGSRNGISGYCYHTVPCVLQVWFRYGEDFTHGLEEIIKAGGDTDTAAAILGGIVGARTGRRGIPRVWLENIAEWPRTVAWMEQLGRALARRMAGIDTSNDCPRYFVPGVLLRNLVFLVIVLAHGFRRLGPPY